MGRCRGQSLPARPYTYTETQPGKVHHCQERWRQDSPICVTGQARLLGGPQKGLPKCAPPGTLPATFSSPFRNMQGVGAWGTLTAASR